MFIYHSPGPAQIDAMLRVTVFFMLLMSSMLACNGAFAAGKQECLSAKETRDIIGANHLLEPLQVTKNMSSLSRAEPISIKLCKADSLYIYEVMLLRKDGKLLRVLVDAVSGKTVSPKSE